MSDFDYDEYVRKNGFVWIEGLGYVSPQMHAEMVRNAEARRREDEQIREELLDQLAREQEWRA